MVRGLAPLLDESKPEPAPRPPFERPPRDARAREPRGRPTPEAAPRSERAPAPSRFPARDREASGEVTYRLAVGSAHRVLPGNIVGAIANEAGLTGADINGIDIRTDQTFVRLPAGLSKEVLERLRVARVRGRPLRIMAVDEIPRPDRSPERPATRRAWRHA